MNLGALVASVALLAGNAFFVGAEFALIAARPTLMEPLAARSRMARSALTAMREIPLMIAGAQLGITACSLGLGALAEPTLVHLLVPLLEAAHVPSAAWHPIAFAVALMLVIAAHTILGEMVPKNLTLAGPERAVVWLGPPMLLYCRLLKPLLVALKWLAGVVLRLWHIPVVDSIKTVYTAEELAGLVGQSRTEGLIDAEEHARITAALALTERTVADVLVPWTSVHSVPDDVTPAQLELIATETGLSRFPVTAGSLVLGFVHVKDALRAAGPAREAPIARAFIRRLPVTPAERTLAELLLRMRRTRTHIALVRGLDGEPAGIVTLDNVLSVVVG